MTINRNNFKVVVILHFIIVIAAAFTSAYVDPATKEIVESLDFGQADFLVSILDIGLLLLWIASLAGLAMFKSWARSIYLFAVIASHVVTIFYDSTIIYGLSAFLYNLLTLLEGFTLCLLYFSPLGQYFTPKYA